MAGAVETTLQRATEASAEWPEALSRIVVRCMSCGAAATGAEALTACPDCGGLLDVVIPLDRALTPGDFGSDLPRAGRNSGVWRYQSLLPALPDDAIVSRWEGNTPLYRDDRLARYAGLEAAQPQGEPWEDQGRYQQ